MKNILIIFCLTISLITCTKTTKLTLADKSIKLHKKSIQYFNINFEEISMLSSYYIAVQGKFKELKEVELFLSGDCLEDCSNKITEPNSKSHCESKKGFTDPQYYIIKLARNKQCNLFFSLESKENIHVEFHYQPTQQISDIETIPLQFYIPSAPIFLEYIPNFPANFLSQAKIYLKTYNTSLQSVYFSTTPFPSPLHHNFTFQLPNYQTPKEYFISFDYKKSNESVFIRVEGKEGVREERVKIGYRMPFLIEEAKCPEGNYLVQEEDDTYCSNCTKNCLECTDNTTCKTCEPDYGVFKDQCMKQECNKNFTEYKDKKGKCVECEGECLYCSGEKMCLQCKGEGVIVKGICEKKVQCKENQYYNRIVNKCLECINNSIVINDSCIPYCDQMNYYNFGTEKCEKCVEHCKECLNGIGCEVCKGGFYKNEKGLCKESPFCKPNEYLAKPGNYCIICPQNCSSCRNESYCQTCKEGFNVVKQKEKDQNLTNSTEQGTAKVLNYQQICLPKCQKKYFFDIDKQKCELCVGNCDEIVENIFGRVNKVWSIVSTLMVVLVVSFI